MAILPERMQRVQTSSFFTPPPTFARTDWRLGFHRRRVRLLAWLTVLPVDGPLPQISQVRAISTPFEASLATTARPARQIRVAQRFAIAMASISTFAPRGSADTCTVARAGNGSVKNSA